MTKFNDDFELNLPRATMPRKGYGRIFVEKEEDIQRVKDIIKEMDEYEYDYLPQDLVAVFNVEDKFTAVTYTHKFTDINLNELMDKCWRLGIKAFYII